jgi:cobalt-zinc-cadmium efflux system outer membrane protein
VARSLRTRDVTVGAQVERVPASTAGATFGINVSIPLYVRYGFEGEIARAEADYTAALLTRQKVVNQAEADMAKSRVTLDGARRRLASFEADILPAAKRALDAIEFAYARGAAGLTDALDARRTWRATQVDLAIARADHAKALAAWQAATEWESAQP